MGSPPLTSDYTELGPAPPLHSTAHLGPTPFPLDFAQPGPMMLSRSCGRLGPSFLASGISRPESIPPLLEAACSGSPTFVHSSARLDFALPLVDFVHAGPVASTRSLACLGLAFFLMGLMRTDPSVPTLDHTQTGLPTLLQSFAHPGLLVLAADHVGAEPALSSRSLGRTDPSFPVLGCTSTDSPPLILDLTDLGFVLPARSYSRLDLVLLLLDLVQFELPTSARNSAQSGSSTPLVGNVCLEPSPLIPDWAILGFAPLVRSSACVGSVSLVPDFGHLDSSSLMRSLARPDLPALMLGAGCLELVSSVPDHSHLDSSVSSRSLVCLGSVLLPPDFVMSDSSMPVQNSYQPGPSSFACGLGWSGAPSPVPDLTQSELPTLLRQFA